MARRRGRARAPGGGFGAGRLKHGRPLAALAERVRARTDVVPRVALSADPALRLDAQLRDAVLFGEAELGAGGLALGRLDDAEVALLASPACRPAATPLRVARLLGAEVLAIASLARPAEGVAAGLAVVQDHLGLFAPNPLVGLDPDELGPRFPDLSVAYDPGLVALVRDVARGMGADPAAAVYAVHPEPNLATPAEYRMLRRLGADWVGWGGVGEAVLARQAGMRVVAVLGAPGTEARLAALVRALVARAAAATVPDGSPKIR